MAETNFFIIVIRRYDTIGGLGCYSSNLSNHPGEEDEGVVGARHRRGLDITGLFLSGILSSGLEAVPRVIGFVVFMTANYGVIADHHGRAWHQDAFGNIP